MDTTRITTGSGSLTEVLDLATSHIPIVPLQSGVVACALYRDGRRVRDVAVEEIGALAGHESGIIWLGLHEPSAQLLENVEIQLGVHDLMVDDATHAHHRPKLDIYDNALFIVLRTGQLIGEEV